MFSPIADNASKTAQTIFDRFAIQVNEGTMSWEDVEMQIEADLEDAAENGDRVQMITLNMVAIAVENICDNE